MGLTQTASRLIKKHGQAATLLRPLPPIDDGFGMVPNPDPPTPYPCTALVATFTVNEEFIAAGLMDVGDQRVLVSIEGLTITPETTDKIKIGTIDLGIVRVVPHAPGGTLFFYEIQGRDYV
ncbi:hypothetical protein OS189_03790 [Sulfitobacter sp. F26169L]|uniref:hypothetical protein n=1 Tax=Sulfitobacter sp. F26169L TaxID=2996015 RepID=UPI002260FCF4|nr:hypothetical protein [Sulfitobacter sp. F26169L]MCX7565466.1 hypothetical protein [Sulfitobacter sp. F26169L]